MYKSIEYSEQEYDFYYMTEDGRRLYRAPPLAVLKQVIEPLQKQVDALKKMNEAQFHKIAELTKGPHQKYKQARWNLLNRQGNLFTPGDIAKGIVHGYMGRDLGRSSFSADIHPDSNSEGDNRVICYICKKTILNGENISFFYVGTLKKIFHDKCGGSKVE
jgi:hypothetical protein